MSGEDTQHLTDFEMGPATTRKAAAAALDATMAVTGEATCEEALIDAVKGQNLWHGRSRPTSPAGAATALAILSGLRARGFDVVAQGLPAPGAEGPRWGDGDEGEAAVRADIDAEEREAVERAWNTGLRGEFIRLVASALPSFDDEGNQASDVAEGMADHFESAYLRAALDPDDPFTGPEYERMVADSEAMADALLGEWVHEACASRFATEDALAAHELECVG